MTDHRAWAKMLAEKALARFGARVWFMGLQGSVRRGAGKRHSRRRRRRSIMRCWCAGPGRFCALQRLGRMREMR